VNVILICPSNGDEDSGFFMHWWVVSTDLGTLTWFNEIRVVAVVDFGESFLSFKIKTGNKSRSSTTNIGTPAQAC
jgi:hypothetical protein